MHIESANPYGVVFAFIAGLACLTAPAILAASWRRRTGVPFKVFFVGMLIFAVFQPVLRLSWLVPLSKEVGDHPEWKLAYLVFAALTAAIFEECGRWIAFRYLLRTRRDSSSAVMYGLGHGGLESMLFTGIGLVALTVGYELAAHGILRREPLLHAIHAHVDDMTFRLSFYALLERAAALAGQIGLTLTVLKTFTSGQTRWLSVAVFLHFLVDFAVVMMDRYWEMNRALTESVVVGLGVGILLFGIAVSGRLFTRQTATSRAPHG